MEPRGLPASARSPLLHGVGVPGCCGVCQVPGLSSGSLAVTRGKSGSQRAKHFILPIQDLIEIREKTQNHMFCNHSARNTSWA